MKWILYNILFATVYAAMMPYFLLRMKRRGGYRARMGDRFAKYPAGIGGDGTGGAIWVHAVSVGEVQVAVQFMRSLRKIEPATRFVFSTTSSTGWKIAEKELAALGGGGDGNNGVVLIYNPLDFPRFTRRALDTFKPRAVVLTETEIWPNFIREIKRRGIPLYLVNARISDRSAKRYPKAKWFLGEIFAAFDRIWAQSEEDRLRLLAAGARDEAIEVTGSFKFDVARRNPAKEEELRKWLEMDTGERRPVLLTGGSTWPGEDVFLLGVYRQLTEKGTDVRLCIAPRHFEKADAIEENIRAAGFACKRRSREPESAVDAAEKPCVYLCDTTGELMGLYGISDVVFVGKSLCAHGAQNMIEPCLCGAATVVGPHTENFRPVMSDLLANDAIVQGRNEAEIAEAIIRFCEDSTARKELGARAEAAVRKRCGATDKVARDFLAGCAAAHGGAETPPPRKAWWKKFLAWVAVAVLAAAYAFSAMEMTPRLEHDWVYLQENVKRTFAEYKTLFAWSCLYPWELPRARETYIRLATRDLAFSPKNAPQRVEGDLKFYRDDDFLGEVVTSNDWPIVTGKRFAGTRALKETIPLIEGEAFCETIDARTESACEIKKRLADYKNRHGAWRLWCVGLNDYIVTPGVTRSADFYLDAFMDEALFEKLADADVFSPAELFASYLGTDRDLGEALDAIEDDDGWFGKYKLPFAEGAALRLRATDLAPEEPVPPEWLVAGTMESEDFDALLEDIARYRAARVEALRGFLAADAGDEAAALGHWAAAAKVDERDVLLRNLADTLDMNARRFIAIGNVNGALKCYENASEIFPDDAATVHNFGVCLKKSGNADDAVKVFMRALALDPENDAHRSELVEAAEAAGKTDLAARQADVLVAHDWGNPAAYLRAAKLWCSKSNTARNDSKAVLLAKEALRLAGETNELYKTGLADVLIETGSVVEGMKIKRSLRK
ncbi:MAG: hypothetical protein IJ802_03680 [Kiritimatiellae bacterium]|nr:hypothetical protein [Kiritimatiellia bacterium]